MIYKKGNRISIATIVSRFIIYAILILYSLIVLVPVIWSIMSAFKSSQEFYVDVWALPKAIKLENFVNAWNMADMGLNILNSIIVVGISLFLTAFFSATIAYAVTRYSFFGNKTIGKLFIAGLFFPLVLGIIPTFFILRQLGLYDTRLGLILVYTVYSMPLSVFIMMGHFETIPKTYAEAAIIDGCGHFRLFFNIMLPLTKSGIAIISIFNFLWTWGDYVYAMTFIPSASKRTLPVGLLKLTSTAMYKTDWGALFAGLVVIMIPSIVVYIIFQKQIQQGLGAGGIKG